MFGSENISSDIEKDRTKIQSHLENYNGVVYIGEKTELLNYLVVLCFYATISIALIDSRNSPSRISKMNENLDNFYSIKGEQELKNFLEGIKSLPDNLGKMHRKNFSITCYTSGTTGIPKAIVITEDNIINMITYCNNMLNFNNQTSIMSLSSISFDMYFAELLLVYFNGGTVFCGDDSSIQEILDIIKKCNTMFVTPSRFEIFSKLNLLDKLRHLKTINFGGEKITLDIESLKNNLKDTQLNNLYGPAETTFFITHNNLNLSRNKNQLGDVVYNNDLILIPQKYSLNYEIEVRGKNVAEGYLLAPKFENSYLTGDFVEKVEGGFNLIGRKDTIVKVNGQRIDIQEIEQILRDSIPGIEMEFDLKKYVLYVNSNETEKIHNIIKDNFPYYYLPNKIINTKPTISLNGKLSFETEKSEQPVLETRNINIFAMMLKKVIGKEVDINKGFFANGGTSINIMEYVFLLKEHDINVTKENVIESNSILELNNYNSTVINNFKIDYIIENIKLNGLRNDFRTKFELNFDSTKIINDEQILCF